MGFATYSRHYDLNSNLAAALMSRYELILAANSASQIVMLDGSVSSAILSSNLAAHASFTTPLTVEFNRNLYEFHLAARTILVEREDDTMYVSCPKATEKQEICYEMEWERTYSDLLSSINEKELLNQLLKSPIIIRDHAQLTPDMPDGSFMPFSIKGRTILVGLNIKFFTNLHLPVYFI